MPRVRIEASCVEDENAEIWESKEMKEWVKLMRLKIGGIGEDRMAMEQEPLRLLQKVPHEVFRSRKQGRTYTEEFQQRFFLAALKGQVLKADEIAEEKSDDEKRRSGERKIRRKRRERNDDVETGQ